MTNCTPLKATLTVQKTLSKKLGNTELSATIAAITRTNSAVLWGDVGGDITQQTDLSDILNGKAPLNHGHDIGEITNTENLVDEVDLINAFNNELA